MPYGRSRFLGLVVVALVVGACGPNVLNARGKVLHPMHEYAEGDTEAARPPRILVIYRKENRVVVKHTIVGPQGRPKALELLGEYALIPDQSTDGSGLYVEALIFSNYKDELVSMEKYGYWLVLPDGRRVKGEVHVARGLKDFTIKVTGAHMAPHLVVKNGGQTRVYRHVEEVENEYQLYSRTVRILFKAPGLITRETAGATFVIEGFDRERRYRFEFTWDPDEAMREAIKHEK